MKGEIENSAVIVGNINAPHLVIDKPTRPKLSKERGDLNNTICQLDLTTIYMEWVNEPN